MAGKLTGFATPHVKPVKLVNNNRDLGRARDSAASIAIANNLRAATAIPRIRSWVVVLADRTAAVVVVRVVVLRDFPSVLS